jgi:alkaline phosphatase D
MKTGLEANGPGGRLNKWLVWMTAHIDALTITILLMVLLLEALYLRGWTYPIIGDRSFHLYSASDLRQKILLGQRLDGGVGGASIQTQSNIQISQEPVISNFETASKSPVLMTTSQRNQQVRLTHGPLVGGVTDTSAVIWMRAEALPQATIVAKLATESTFENALTFPFSSSGPDATWKANATGLHPHTTYYVDIESNGESQMRGRYSKFTTFVPRGKPANFRFAILTDFFGNANSGVFEQVAQHESSLDFVYLGGDFWHRNIDDMQGKRDRFKFMYSLRTPRGYASYFVRGILSRYPVAHCYDDHDMGKNDADKTYPRKAETLQVLQEFFPTYPMSPQGCWQKFSYGQADFFTLDTRSQRDPVKTPDGPGKSLLDGDDLGDEGQWRWLENGLLNSTAKWKFIFSGSPFNPTVKKRDAWYGYPDERDRLIELIRSNGIQGVVIISGDLHAGGIDDGKSERVSDRTAYR